MNIEMDSFGQFFKKMYTKLPVVTFDVLSIPLAWCFAYLLRYNLEPLPDTVVNYTSFLAFSVVFVLQTYSYYHFKVYRGLWQFSSLNDLRRISFSVIYATILAIPVLYLTSLIQAVPRAVFPLYTMVLIMLLSGGRLLFRSYWTEYTKDGHNNEVKRVLIVGAGPAGENIIRDLKRTKSYLPIGVVDDSIGKRGLEVHGVRVLGTIADLQDLVRKNEIDFIFIAIPSAGSALMRRIVGLCETCKIPFHTLPGLQDLASGRVQLNALRQVKIDDLLGRDQIQLSWDKIETAIQDKRVLVTGGGGSIGSELCRQILFLRPSKLLILDNCELNLYRIDQELRGLYPHVLFELALVSVTDVVAIEHLFRSFQPELVFHAAAYKHVPLLEHQIRIAVQNNVLGTQIVAQASAKFDVDKFILISTDKAVNPTNIMGTTKRVAEIYCQNVNARVRTQFITVRFGNVLGSAGSVVPLFQRQLEKGGPLTVTHPDMERYFMTIPEASQLILQAMVNGHGGEIFVLDMGEPIKISYLAEQMILLSGKKPNEDILIEYTGLRPGEKLFEELFHESEQLEKTCHVKLFKAKFRQMDWVQLTQTMRMLQAACAESQNEELLVLLKSLVPEFCGEWMKKEESLIDLEL